MAATLNSTGLQSGDANPPVFKNSSGTEVGQLCRAWVNFNGSTGAINASFNVSSVTLVSTGTYTVSFTNAFPNTNYVFAGSAKCDTDGAGYAPVIAQRLSDAKAVGSLTLRTMNTSMGLITPNQVYVEFFR